MGSPQQVAQTLSIVAMIMRVVTPTKHVCNRSFKEQNKSNIHLKPCEPQEKVLREAGIPVPEGDMGNKKSYTLRPPMHCVHKAGNLGILFFGCVWNL